MKKHIGYIILSCIILVLVSALVFVLLQPKGASSNNKVVAARPIDIPEKVYSLDDFRGLEIKNGYALPAIGYGDITPRYIDQLNRTWPITNLQQVRNNLVYTVYTIQSKEIGDYSMFVFFEPGKDGNGNITTEGPLEQPERWQMTGQVIYMKKTLSFADFSSLRIGDSAEKAATIDPIVGLMEKEAAAFGPSTGTYFHTNHLLTDGSLLLVFSRNSVYENFTLASIEFDENFIFDGPDGEKELRIRASDYANK